MKRSTIILLSLGCIFFLLLACAVIAGLFIFSYVIRPADPIPSPVPTPSIEYPSEPPAEGEDDPSGLIRYTNELFNISLEYPADWDLEEELTDTEGVCESFSLSISKDSDTFGYYLPCATGIAVCIYDDTPFDPNLPEYIEFSSYVPLINDGRIYRRSYDQENRVWNVCEYNSMYDFYLNAVVLGSVYYETADPSSAESLNTLDQILYSLEPIN